jgi:hypothetical protein
MHTVPTKEPRVHLLPTTPVGWRAFRVIGVAVVCGALAPPFGPIPEGSFFWIRVVGLQLFYGLAFLAALLGSALSLTAIIRDHDRALSVFVPLLFLLMYVWILVAGLWFGVE